MDFFDRLNTELKAQIDLFPNVHYFDLDLLRNNPQELHEQRVNFVSKNPTPKPKTIITSDIYIKSSLDDATLRLHIYRHEENNNKQVLIYFHGGGYLYGLPEQADEFLYKLVEELKITIVAPCYRLAPKYKFPIPIQDGYDALNWLIKNGEEHLDVDVNNIGVYGVSAGGHLAAAVCQKAADNNIDNIKLQFLLYPVITPQLNTSSMLEFTDIPFWNSTYAKISWEHFLGKENLQSNQKYVDLLNYKHFKKLPKTIIVACELDPLRDEDIAYGQKLVEAKVSTELWLIPGAMHVFDRFKCSITNEFIQFNINRLNSF